MVTIFLVGNTPICNRCLAYAKENPDVIEVDYSFGPMERIYVIGINSTPTAVAYPNLDIYLN